MNLTPPYRLHGKKGPEYQQTANAGGKNAPTSPNSEGQVAPTASAQTTPVAAVVPSASDSVLNIAKIFDDVTLADNHSSDHGDKSLTSSSFGSRAISIGVHQKTVISMLETVTESDLAELEDEDDDSQQVRNPRGTVELAPGN